MDAVDQHQKAKDVKDNIRNIIKYDISSIIGYMKWFSDELCRKYPCNETNECRISAYKFYYSWGPNKDVITNLWNYIWHEIEIKGNIEKCHLDCEEEKNENAEPSGAVLLLEKCVAFELPTEPIETEERRHYFIKYWTILFNKITAILLSYCEVKEREYTDLRTDLKVFLAQWKEYGSLVDLIWKNVFNSELLVLNLSQKAIYWKETAQPRNIPQEMLFKQGWSRREDKSAKAKDSQTQTDDVLSHSGAGCISATYKGYDQVHKFAFHHNNEPTNTNDIAEMQKCTHDVPSIDKQNFETDTVLLKEPVSVLETEFKTERQNIYELKCQLNSTECKCKELEADKKEVHKTWKNFYDKTITEYESQKDQLKKQLADKEKEMRGLQICNQTLLEQCQELSKQRQESVNIIHTLKEQETRYKTNNDYLIRTERKLEETISDLENVNKALSQQSDAMNLQYKKEHEHSVRLLCQNKELDDRSKAYERELEKLKEEKQQYIQRLSEKMSQQLARDETGLENISVETAPLKLKEEYVAVFCGQWLEAKSTLDENAEKMTKNNTEEDFCNFLVDIISECHVFATELHRTIVHIFEDYIVSPIQPPVLDKVEPPFPGGNWWKNTPQSNGANTAPFRLSEDFRVKLCYHLKRTSVLVDWKDLAKELLKSQLDKKFRGQDHEFFVTNGALRDYVMAFLALSWKMVLQQPPMHFKIDFDDMNRQFDASKHELTFRSADPNDPGVCITYVVTPALWHGEKQLTKAKVFLQRCNGPKTDGQHLCATATEAVKFHEPEFNIKNQPNKDEESKKSSHHQTSPSIAARGDSCNKVEEVVDNGNMNSPRGGNTEQEYTLENEHIGNDPKKGNCATYICTVETAVEATEDFETTPVANSALSLQPEPEQHEHAHGDGDHKRHLAITGFASLPESLFVLTEETSESDIKAQTGAQVTKDKTITPDDADNQSMDNLTSRFGNLNVTHP